MKIKILSLIIAMLTIVALLASCGGGGDTGDGTGGGTGDGTGDGTGGGTGDGTGDTADDGYAWGNTSVVMQLNMNSSSGELSSGAQLYYSGEDLTGQKPVHKAVRTRNEKAELATKTDVRYTYIGEDQSAYGWGGSIKAIQDEVALGGSSAPDMYVNFVYDLTCASIRNAFANLRSQDTTVYENGNYFLFNDADYNPSTTDYFDSDAGGGYFYEYMKSLSLTPDTRLYCVASNYTLDLVRAFYVMPVNVTLMNRITDATKAPAGDSNGDGHNILDFYDFVWRADNPWTYETLATYASFYQGNTNENPYADMGDEAIGLAVGKNSGLSSSGLLYTTDVKLLQYDTTEGKYVYPSTPGELSEITNALYKLFSENRYSITTVTATGLPAAYSNCKTELTAIRQKFSEDGVLFGGVICVGSLEDTVYQAMNNREGFGVVPVPVYKAGEEYLTSVHNIARIAVISRASDAKSQCSAFLNYQSVNSASILEDYYENVLTAATNSALSGDANSKMLTYIRNHVRSCFDKTFEDVIANYMCENTGTDEPMHMRWAQILADAGYEIESLDADYASYYEEKSRQLEIIYTQWTNNLTPAN